jgi:hypothetical protein
MRAKITTAFCALVCKKSLPLVLQPARTRAKTTSGFCALAYEESLHFVHQPASMRANMSTAFCVLARKSSLLFLLWPAYICETKSLARQRFVLCLLQPVCQPGKSALCIVPSATCVSATGEMCNFRQ